MLNLILIIGFYLLVSGATPFYCPVKLRFCVRSNSCIVVRFRPIFATRVYLIEINKPSDNDKCLGAIVGKNPGSARGAISNELIQIDLQGDKLLPTVRNIFENAYKKCAKEILENSYIQVLNLFIYVMLILIMLLKNMKIVLQKLMNVKIRIFHLFAMFGVVKIRSYQI